MLGTGKGPMEQMTRSERLTEGDRAGRGDRTVIFLHLGKTAGSTLRQVMRRNFSPREILRADRHGRPREEALNDFARVPIDVRASARLIVGHTIFGIHELLPQPSTYITMVRDPLALVVSQYRFILRRPGHRLHRQVARAGMSLADYVRSGLSVEADNGQTRAIAGDTSTLFGACTEEMLRIALANIDRHFAVAGLTERFDESLLLLRETLGWRHLCYVRANVAPDRTGPRDLPAETRRLIDEHTELDRELYGRVRDRLRGQMAAVSGFDRRLARFRAVNRLYRPWGLLTYSMPKQARLRLRRGQRRAPAA
jgi:Galactose-3-O-sulfotransferase